MNGGPDTPLEEQRALVALSLVPGVAAGRLRQLLSAFGSAREALAASRATLGSVPGIGRRTAARIASFEDEGAVDRQLASAARAGATMVPIWDDRYPFLLKQIFDPPVFLWVRGQMPRSAETDRAVAIVGTRRPTSYGRRVAQEMSAALARLGFTIVSGLAYGIDAAAHAAALEVGGRTVAVLGSGVDRIYPSRHRRLAHEMLERGALLSEFPLGARPDAVNFPRRNRLVSGLAAASIIVEAYEEGGALITAALAVDQNRDVFAVPGPIHSPASAGTNRLIQRLEAKLVQNVGDVLSELGVVVDASVMPLPVDASTLAPDEQRLCRVLTDDPMHIDAVCAASGVDASVALVHLLQLEFRGVVRQAAGKHFYLAGRLAS